MVMNVCASKNYMKRIRQQDLLTVKKWVDEAGGFEKIDQEALIQKIVLVQGATRKKATEYLRDLGYMF